MRPEDTKLWLAIAATTGTASHAVATVEDVDAAYDAAEALIVGGIDALVEHNI